MNQVDRVHTPVSTKQNPWVHTPVSRKQNLWVHTPIKADEIKRSVERYKILHSPVNQTDITYYYKHPPPATRDLIPKETEIKNKHPRPHASTSTRIHLLQPVTCKAKQIQPYSINLKQNIFNRYQMPSSSYKPLTYSKIQKKIKPLTKSKHFRNEFIF